MTEQMSIPGVDVPVLSLGEQIRELIKATRERIFTLEVDLATAKKELAEAKQAVVGTRKTRKVKAAKTKTAKRTGRPKGSKNKKSEASEVAA